MNHNNMKISNYYYNMPNNNPYIQLFGAILGFFASLEFFQNGFKTILMGALWALGFGYLGYE